METSLYNNLQKSPFLKSSSKMPHAAVPPVRRSNKVVVFVRSSDDVLLKEKRES